MKKRIKKAALIAAFGYLSVTGLGFGMLKAAQQTRRTLYGGAPVMAQVTQQQTPEAAEITLGGGEWHMQIQLPELQFLTEAADALPPSLLKLLLRIFLFADRAAVQTAETIGM